MDDIKDIAIYKRPGSYSIQKYQKLKEYEILYMVRGKCGISFPDRQISFETGSLLFINHHVLYKFVSIAEEEYDYFRLCFRTTLLIPYQGMFPNIDFSSLIQRPYMLLTADNIDQQFIKSLIKPLLTSFDNLGLADFKGMVYLKTTEFVAYLLLKSYNQPEVSLSKKYSKIKEKNYEELTQYIIQNEYNVTLDELSQQFFLNRYYICHLFQEIGNITLVEYLNTNKLKKAQELLEHTDMPITEIAGQCGYENIGNFGRTFKKYIGVSPTEYRKRTRLLRNK